MTHDVFHHFLSWVCDNNDHDHNRVSDVSLEGFVL